MSCCEPQDYSGLVYSDGLVSAAGYIWKRDRYEEDIEGVKDVTGTRIVKVENERLLEKGEAFRGTTRATGTAGVRGGGAEPGDVIFSLLRRNVDVLSAPTD